MNNDPTLIQVKKIIVSAAAIALLAGVAPAHATQTVRELWDKTAPPGNVFMGSGIGDGTTSVGFVPGTVWYYNRGSKLLEGAQNFNVWGVPGLPADNG
jgi:hypothetical protein